MVGALFAAYNVDSFAKAVMVLSSGIDLTKYFVL